MEMELMRYRIIAMILALSFASWAQIATQNIPAPTPQEKTSAKTSCACCDHAGSADAKQTHGCCGHHHDMAATDAKTMSCCDGKDAACCGGADAKSCKHDSKDKAATAGDNCCGGDKEKGSCPCCKRDVKTAMGCCQHTQSAASTGTR